MRLAIIDAMIYDGSGRPPFSGSILCEGGVIARCARGRTMFSGCDEVIDAAGLALAPGFIDAHSHSDISLLAAPEAAGKVSQGITTEIIGNCGLSVYPVTDNNREHLQELYRNYNVEISWHDLTGYLREVARRRPAVDVVPLAGHNTLRASVCGYGKHQLSTGELMEMRKLLANCFEQGAAGFSTGLLYVPGKFADIGELAGLLRTVSEYDKVYTTHLRSEGNGLLEAVEETFAAARLAGLKRVHLSHLKVAGKANRHKIDDLLAILERARGEGFKLSADRYPYTESLTQLSVMLPVPYDELDDIALGKILRTEKGFTEIVTALKQLPAERWRAVRLVSAEGYEEFCSRNFTAIAAALKRAPAEICAEILRADAAGTLAAFQGMHEANMLRIMEQDFVACGTDESARPQDYSLGRSHPRGFGSMPRFCNFLREQGMPLEKIIFRLTALPAGIFGLPGKGLIKENFAADLVLFDPDEFADTATFAKPHQVCRGIRKSWRRAGLIYSVA
ncbi:MAG: amidohydrolase family protein [Victivallales bacterium]|nr:amidohydrolase family protein [Victivallales bacterium]